MIPFCARLFEDKAGDVFFAHGFTAYDEKTLRKREKDFPYDFPYGRKLVVRWFYEPVEFTECLARSNRPLYFIEGNLFDQAKRKARFPFKLLGKTKEGTVQDAGRN